MSGAQVIGGSTLVGRVLAGRYSIRSLLGRGGMGEVYEAHDDVLQRIVAVKILPAVASGDSRSLARLRREARAAAGLAHPNCVAVHDLVVADGRAFIVMELVRGRSLSRMLDDGAPLPLPLALRIARDVAEALAYAHARGVIHRDIAPGNVIIRPDGRAKVLDFGLARAEDWTPVVGASPSPHGTMAYLSPEQVEGLHGDARSDVYSLGCVLYEMLTGVPPFAGPSPAAVAAQHLRAAPVPPGVLRPAVPREVEAVVARCLMKAPGERFGSGTELAAALDAIGIAPRVPPRSLRRDTRMWPTRPLRRDARMWPTPQLRSDEKRGTPPPPARSRRGRWTVGVAATVAAVLLAIVALSTARLLISPPPQDTLRRPHPVVPPTDVVAQGVCDGFLSARVDVSWVPTASVANGYEVYRSTSPTGRFRLVARIPGRDATSFHDVDLGLGATYYYVLRSVVGGRLSALTDAAAADTPLFCLG